VAPKRRKCVVLWHNKAGRDMMAYPPYVIDEQEALRKAGGVFKLLLSRDVHADVMSTGKVYWEGSSKYNSHLNDAQHFRNMYEQKRDKGQLARGKIRVEKTNSTPFPAIISPKSRNNKINPNQQSLF